MTLRTRGLAALGVVLGCASLLMGLLGAEQLLQRLHGHSSLDVVAFLLITVAEVGAALLLAAVALVCLYAATRAPRARHVRASAAHHHQAVTL